MKEVLLLSPRIFPDGRGFFLEWFNEREFGEAGLQSRFVQDNHSRSKMNVLRGLHYQIRHPQGKLVTVIRGRIFDVAADVRRGSPTFGQWVGVFLDDQECESLWIPPGFAHGFAVISDEADVVYKCTDYYDATGERGVHWQDPTLGIEWPIDSPIVSEKDGVNPRLHKLGDELPFYDEHAAIRQRGRVGDRGSGITRPS